MSDVIFIVLTIAFFAAACGLVVACDRLIGPDVVSDSEAAPPQPQEPERPESAAA
jgi:hypothetical protein